MGRLLKVHGCPVCNYYVEDELHEGSSGIAPEFIRNRYALAICHNCNNLVSVFTPATEDEIRAALDDTRDAIEKMESDATGEETSARDMVRARDLLPLFRETLDTFDESIEPEAVSACTICGSHNIEIVRDVTGGQFDDQDAWIHCPSCKEGRLLVGTTGYWD